MCCGIDTKISNFEGGAFLGDEKNVITRAGLWEEERGSDGDVAGEDGDGTDGGVGAHTGVVAVEVECGYCSCSASDQIQAIARGSD